MFVVLAEQNEELQAIVLNRGVEEGRNLLNGTSNSLAHELGEMSQRQVFNVHLILFTRAVDYCLILGLF